MTSRSLGVASSPAAMIEPKFAVGLSKISPICNFLEIVGASFAIYQLYQCYQWSYHFFTQDNYLKSVASQMHLAEVLKRLNDTVLPPDPDECDTLVQSLNFDPKPQAIVLKLVERFAKTDSQAACNLALKFCSGHNTAKALLAIAKILLVDNQEQAEKFVAKAELFFDRIDARSDLIQVKLAAAHIFCDLNKIDEVNRIMQSMYSLHFYDSHYPIVDFLSFVKLQEKVFKIEPHVAIETALKQLAMFPQQGVNQLQSYLEVASVCQEYKLQEKAEIAFRSALTILEDLPKPIDFKSLISMAECRGGSDQIKEKLFLLLKECYDASSADEKVTRGAAILRCCDNKLFTGVDVTRFFEEYLDFCLNKKEKHPHDLIIALTTVVRLRPDEFKGGITIEQHRRLLQVAMGRISKVPSNHYTWMVGDIAAGYLKIDPQAGLQILNGYRRRQALRHFAFGAVTAVVLVILRLSPRTRLYHFQKINS